MKGSIIKGLQCCSLRGMNTCELQECPYYSERYDKWNRCTNQLATDVLALQEEQEKRINYLEKMLGLLEYGDQDYCHECGRKIKWK